VGVEGILRRKRLKIISELLGVLLFQTLQGSSTEFSAFIGNNNLNMEAMKSFPQLNEFHLVHNMQMELKAIESSESY
jgi:hypothetical protein